MRVLEVMSGTGSIGRAFRELGAEVTSLDCDPKAGADICCEVMAWLPDKPPGYWDVIWFSPPCTEFSSSDDASKAMGAGAGHRASLP